MSITCEVAPLELLRRHTARAINTYLGKLKSGELAPIQLLALVRLAAQVAPQMTFLDATTALAIVRDCAATHRIC